MEKGGSAGEQAPSGRPGRSAERSDFGPVSVTQIAYVAKSLLPIVHLLQAQSSSQHAIPVAPYLATFYSAVQNLRDLRPRFDSVLRDLGPVEEYARKLGVALPESSNTASGSNWTPDANLDPGLVDAVSATLPGEAETGHSAGQGRQTSGSGAIQALLSLSGRVKDDITASAEGVAGTEGEQASSAELNAWWASILGGTSGDQEETGFSI